MGPESVGYLPLKLHHYFCYPRLEYSAEGNFNQSIIDSKKLLYQKYINTHNI